MRIRKISRKITITSYFTLIIIILMLEGCGTSPSSTQSNQTTNASSQATFAPTPTLTSSSANDPTSIPTDTPSTNDPASAPTPTTSVTGLQGPTNFLLNNELNFSSASGTGTINGATTQLSESGVETGVIQNLQHTLFVVDSNDNVTVYSDASPSPTQAQVSQNADNSTTIQYTQSSSSSTTSFNGTLTGDQMNATYSGETLGGATVDGQVFSGGTTYTANFVTQVTWASSDQIPAPPTNGSYQLTADGGVQLSWAAGGATQKYNIYRFVLTSNQGFQLLDSTTATSYIDESPIAQSNAQTITGIAYAIYAVGSTGIENPRDLVISVSSSV